MRSYDEEVLEGGDVRTVLRLHPALAPYKCAILPLQKKLAEPAQALYAALSKHFMVDYDEAGSIGKRYRRQDENGTPFCITIDFDTLEKGTVTIRERDTMAQITLPKEQVADYIESKIGF